MEPPVTIAAYRTSLPKSGCRAEDDLRTFSAMQKFDGARRKNVARESPVHVAEDTSVVISEYPSQEPYNSQSPRIIILSPTVMHEYSMRHGQTSFPHAVGEGNAHDRYPEYLYHDYASKKWPNDFDDIIDILNQEINFYGGAAYYDYDAQYFDVEDLYPQYGDSEYDYPRAVDEDDDPYLGDSDLCMGFEQSIFSGQQARRDSFETPDSKEMTNAQYFDALELCDLEDILVASNAEEELERVTEGTGHSMGINPE